MGVLNDFYCPECGREERNVVLPSGQAPVCSCDALMRTLWDHGQAPSTDVRGQSFYSDAADCWFTSSRERTRYMRNVHREIGSSGFSVRGYEEAGDKVGGARPDLSIKNTAYSGLGTSRTSTGERALSRNRTTSR